MSQTKPGSSENCRSLPNCLAARQQAMPGARAARVAVGFRHDSVVRSAYSLCAAHAAPRVALGIAVGRGLRSSMSRDNTSGYVVRPSRDRFQTNVYDHHVYVIFTPIRGTRVPVGVSSPAGLWFSQTYNAETNNKRHLPFLSDVNVVLLPTTHPMPPFTWVFRCGGTRGRRLGSFKLMYRTWLGLAGATTAS